MRRLKEMDELGQAVQDGMMLKTPSSSERAGNTENGLLRPTKAASDLGMSSPSRTRSDSGYGSERRASYDVVSEVGSSVSRRPPRSEGGSSASLAPTRPHHGQQASSSASALSVPQYQYVERPGHSQQPSYLSQRSDVTARSTSTHTVPQSEYYQYPQTPSAASTSQAYPATPTQPVIQAVDSRHPPPPRGHYHPLAQNVPNTPQTWSNPQNPSYHQPMTPLPARRPPPTPASPYHGSDPGGAGAGETAQPRMERRSESRLAVRGPGTGYAYTAGGRPRSGSSQSGMSVRTTASEEIKRRAMKRWGE